jgi:5'-nucleotidase
MRFLLTNDDGIDAPGLAALERAASQLGEASVVAPAREFSSCSHQVTTRSPLVVRRAGPGRWAVDGWPADCARVALCGLELGVDWVLAGINAGGNMGADVFISGTVAAVREALLLGKPGIALSHYKRRELAFDWEAASAWVLPILRELTQRDIEPGCFWNVNLPHLPPGSPVPEIVFCPLDLSPMPVRYRLDGEQYVYAGDYHSRPHKRGGDVEVCFSGKVAVSLVRVA